MTEPAAVDAAEKKFAALKFAWIEAVCMDPALTAYAKALGPLLMSMVNREKGYAWPSIDTLRDLSRKSSKAAREAINQLERAGHLRIERGGGLAITNRYYPIWPKARPDGRSPVMGWLQDRKGAQEKAAKHSPTGGGSTQSIEAATVRDPSPPKSKPSPSSELNPHPSVSRTLEWNPGKEPCSDPNGSDAAVAPSSHRSWKGTAGDPLPSGFPHESDVLAAAETILGKGAKLDARQLREDFRRKHFAERCLQRDWPFSWERFVEDAIERTDPGPHF